MGKLISTVPTSRRGYLSQSELEQYANITITDVNEADDIISQAEELVDSYVKYVQKDIVYTLEGEATAGTTTTLVDDSGDTPLDKDDDFFKLLEISIIGGTNAGERRTITGSVKSTKTLTFPAFTSAIDNTSVYVIQQLGKFPRHQDTIHRLSKYYKVVPEAVRRATAAQVEYMKEKGTKFFTGAADFKSESIDDYSYTRADGSSGVEAMIAPKARMLLRGFVVRIGTMQG
jgi:hypothetical protein